MCLTSRLPPSAADVPFPNRSILTTRPCRTELRRLACFIHLEPCHRGRHNQAQICGSVTPGQRPRRDPDAAEHKVMVYRDLLEGIGTGQRTETGAA